jgi:hypothetical protein
VGPRAGLDRSGKSPLPPPGFDPRTFHPIASRYTDSAISSHSPIYLQLLKAVFGSLSAVVSGEFASCRRSKSLLFRTCPHCVPINLVMWYLPPMETND